MRIAGRVRRRRGLSQIRALIRVPAGARRCNRRAATAGASAAAGAAARPAAGRSCRL